MKLTVQQVFDATQVLAKIINEARPMPQKGKYRVARMHAKLYPEFTTISARRDEMITAYNHHPMVQTVSDDLTVTEAPSAQFSVPDDKMPEFTAAWKEIGDEVIEVNVEPIPFAQIDLGDSVDGGIQAGELLTLGELVGD